MNLAKRREPSLDDYFSHSHFSLIFSVQGDVIVTTNDVESLTIEGAGSVIRDLRESLGQSLAEFSASIGMPESSYKRIEDNEFPLSLRLLTEIAAANKIMPEELTMSCLKAAHPHLENTKIGELFNRIVAAIKELPNEEGTRPTAADVDQVVGVSADAAIQTQPCCQENHEHTGSEGVAEDKEDG